MILIEGKACFNQNHVGAGILFISDCSLFPHALERNTDGQWLLDNKEITQEQAITELAEAVRDLGYWCQVAKDILPEEDFNMVQEAYED